jgi:hypothetical protein
MKMRPGTFRPRRKEGIVRTLKDEVLVYDPQANKAHCLNESAGKIWKRCDGRTTVKEISHLITKETRCQIDEDVVWIGLRRLGKAGLLAQESLPAISITRRAVIRKLGAAAAIAIPAVMSIIVPTPAEAASCAMLGQSCRTLPCCAGMGLLCVPLTKVCA